MPPHILSKCPVIAGYFSHSRLYGTSFFQNLPEYLISFVPLSCGLMQSVHILTAEKIFNLLTGNSVLTLSSCCPIESINTAQSTFQAQVIIQGFQIMIKVFHDVYLSVIKLRNEFLTSALSFNLNHKNHTR